MAKTAVGLFENSELAARSFATSWPTVFLRMTFVF